MAIVFQMNSNLDNIKAIFFDFDDTLIHVKYAMNTAIYALAILLSNKFSISILKIMNSLYNIQHTMIKDGVLDRNKWWLRLASCLNIELSDDLIHKLTETYWNIIIRYSYVDPETIQILYKLKNCGYILSIISNTDGNPNIKLKRIQNALPIDLFNVIIIAGEDTKSLKPSVEPFILALKRLKLNANESIYIGDDIYYDVLGAKKVGMITILLQDERITSHSVDNHANINPDFKIRRLNEILNIIKCEIRLNHY